MTDPKKPVELGKLIGKGTTITIPKMYLDIIQNEIKPNVNRYRRSGKWTISKELEKLWKPILDYICNKYQLTSIEIPVFNEHCQITLELVTKPKESKEHEI